MPGTENGEMLTISSSQRQRGNGFRSRIKSACVNMLLVILLAACGAEDERQQCASDRRCLAYGITADIPILDPHRASAPEAGMIFRQIYDSLLYRDSETHDFVPGLASSWQVSNDGLAYTFNLRQDIQFHSGSRFDAQAVARNIDRIYDPAITSSRARQLLGPLNQYEIVDDYTIRFHLFSPYEAFLDAWSQPFLGIANPEALREYGLLRYQFHQDGTGPFALAEYLPGERVKLQRHAGYSLLPAVYQKPDSGEFETVEFSFVAEAAADPLTLVAVTLDVLDDIAPVAAQNLAANSRVRILPTRIPGQSAQFLFNTNREHLSSPVVRRALLLATNRVAINNLVFLSFSPIAWAPLSASTGYSHDGYVNTFPFDLAEAQRLLSEAGYADADGDGILERQDIPLALTIVTPPWGNLPDVAAYLRQQWRAIGIDLTIEPVPGRARLEDLIATGAYDLLPVDNYGIDPELLSRIFQEESVYQASQVPNETLMALLRAASQERDPARRRSQYYEVQALLMNETLLLPIREPVRLTATRAEIEDLHFDAFGFYPLLYNARGADG